MNEHLPRFVALDDLDTNQREVPPPEAPPGASSPPLARTFVVERWPNIHFNPSAEWLVKRILPRRGLAAIYGKPGSYKSFVAMHLGLCIALGRPWAGRRSSPGAVVYIAAEGDAGIRKRREGYVRAWDELPVDVNFALISAAPNLGASPGDLHALVAAIDAAGIAPTLIIIDTVAKSIGAGDENGAGMSAFVGNAGALARRFDCLVLAVHHVGHGDEAQKRMRGHSSFHGALDAQILCERFGGELTASLTLQKLKDDASDVKLTVRMTRVVVGEDEDGDDASTLIVDDVTDAAATTPQRHAPTVPRSQRLLRDVIERAINESGETIQPYDASGPTVQAVHDERARALYYAAIAEQAGRDEDPDKLAERQRRAFNRAIADMLDAKTIAECRRSGRRFLWFS